jgi:hypothetical protein
VRACDCRRGFNSSSPAMLITRQGGRVGRALAVAYCRRRVHRKSTAKIDREIEPLGNLVRARGESAGACGASRGASADSGVHEGDEA